MLVRSIGLASLLTACGGTATSVPTVPVQSGTFEVTLSVPGTIEAVNEKLILAPRFNGRPEIAWIAEQGQVVAQGERIVEFDRAELLEKLDVAENELELAKTKILQNESKLRLAVDEANAGITNAELDLRLASMKRTDSDTVPLVEREAARISETKSKMAIDAAKASLESVQLESRAETQLLQLEVEKQTREVAELREQLEKTVVTAPTDGVVLIQSSWDGYWKVGSRPWSGAELISLPDLAEMKVAVEVHEVDSPRILKGQKATVVLDAFPDRVVHGTVGQVADLAVAKGEDEIKYLEAEVLLEETRSEMLPGLSARVELVLEEVPNAMWVPIEAVHKEDDAAWVHVSGLTGWSRQDVEIGVENDTHVVVTGLTEGDVVALVDPDAPDAARPAAQP
ncbi:MAG: efflux RND transporter periplasmic adaptor subunit [Myxococcota bacterium]